MNDLFSDGHRAEEEAREALDRERADPDYDPDMDARLSRILVRVDGYLSLRERSLAPQAGFGPEPDRAALKAKLADSGRELMRILRDAADRLERKR